MLSQGRAAEVAGVSRQEFLASLGRFNVSPFQVTPDELEQEWRRKVGIYYPTPMQAEPREAAR